MNPSRIEPISDLSVDKKTGWKSTVSKIEAFLGEKPFGGAFLTTLLFSLPIIAAFKAYFQWSDDYYAVLILKGIAVNWTPSELNILQNPLLGLALKNLYIQFPSIQWYPCLFVFVHFLSIWAVLTAFNLGLNRFLKNVLFILGTAVIAVRFFISIQFTVVAASAGIGAFLLLAAVWKKNDSKFLRPALCLVFGLILMAVLIRPYSLLLIILVSVPAAVYLSWRITLTPHRRSILFFLALTTVLSLAAVVFHHYYYDRDPAWKKYAAVAGQYVQLGQFRNPKYTEADKPIFDSIGWTANDLNLFKYNYFLDPDTYSTEKLQKLNDYFPQFTFNKDTPDSFGAMFSNPGFLAGLLFFFALLPFLEGEFFRFIILDAVWTILILCFFRFYLKMPERIFLPCLYWLNNLAILFAVSIFRTSAKNPGKRTRAFPWGAALLTLSFLFTAYLLYFHYVRSRYWITKEAQLKSAVEYLNPQDDQLFVTWSDAFSYTKISAFDNDEFLRHFHALSLDWFQQSPITSAMMDHYGLKNPFKDLVDNPKVFLIAHAEELNLYRIYMKEKYNKNITFKVYFNSGQFAVLSVLSQ